MRLYKFWFLALLVGGLFACEPHLDDKSDLGPLPNPSFEIMPGSSLNDFRLVNTTDGAFITNWELGGQGNAQGEEVEVNFPFMGTYDITMTTFNSGGSASLTKQLVVTQDDPNACNGNFLLLTGCGEKTWVLAPEAGALHVGPNLVDVWWNNNDSDVVDRTCHFDDQYIFRSDGEYEYDNLGDFWADSDENGNIWPADLGLAVGCQTEWPAAYSSWGSGVHGFTVTNNTLTVSGLGAWIGLYKVGTSAEVTSPQQSVTYNIDQISEDRMVLYTDYGGLVWRFTLVAL